MRVSGRLLPLLAAPTALWRATAARLQGAARRARAAHKAEAASLVTAQGRLGVAAAGAAVAAVAKAVAGAEAVKTEAVWADSAVRSRLFLPVLLPPPLRGFRWL